MASRSSSRPVNAATDGSQLPGNRSRPTPKISCTIGASQAGVFANFPDDVRTGAVSKYELVVVDGSGDVAAAMTLSCYICSDDDQDDGGVSVDIAVLADCRGRGIAPSTLTGLAGWVASLVPTAHAHADVCTKNYASTKAVCKRVDGNVPCNIHHDCDMKAVRFCAHQSH